MPKKFIKAEKAFEKAIKTGKIPKFYWKGGVKHISNPYALARHATGYHGTTHDLGMKHIKKRKGIFT